MSTEAINEFLLKNRIYISNNPCISPDFCLSWPDLQINLVNAEFEVFEKSEFEIAEGTVQLIGNDMGDCAWLINSTKLDILDQGILLSNKTAYPASFANLLKLKNLIQEHDADSTIFPNTAGTLAKQSLGIGARFTTLHWPGVDWVMSNLNLSLTANQNSIPRELVYDVDEMLNHNLDTCLFPFIGASVPEGHQGQSVEGMSHGCILAKLKTGFHKKGIAWSFNADHQPIGGKYDPREDQLVTGCLLASYITFDLSPELAETEIPEDSQAYVNDNIDAELVAAVKAKVANAGLSLDDKEFNDLMAYVWPSMKKMKQRDTKYTNARIAAFSKKAGQIFLRELSIDELPGLTTPATTAIMLALCLEMGMPIHYIAPAFGFQKNFPYPDNDALRTMIEEIWTVCKSFDVSIGFHSGSGKSAENYQVMGEVTGSLLEIKTSGRYTYEMGVALSKSSDETDQKLWTDWYAFTKEMSVNSSFSDDETESTMARSFIVNALEMEGKETDVFSSIISARSAIDELKPNPDHMFWFEYNFLYVLAAGGAADKASLGNHDAEGYKQRERFYSISDEGRLNFAKAVASYIIFLAENTGLASKDICQTATDKLEGYTSFSELLDAIG
ncbi:MAG: hypothetical protein HRT89_11430 [Lentisphaeria bacterium]|nr:tagaturonate epimerase family protein [Lentisphaeria bacterium]NQZ68667.1 hypothetical protein [Lentisphaeria bacterium]